MRKIKQTSKMIWKTAEKNKENLRKYRKFTKNCNKINKNNDIRIKINNCY